MKLAIADDHQLVRDVLSAYLEASLNAEIFQAGSLEGLLDLFRDHGPFDVALVDFSMPGMQGIDGIRRCLEASAGHPVVLLSGRVSAEMVRDALDLGLAGYFPKSMGARSMVNAIHFVLAGERYVPPAFVLDWNTCQVGKVSLTRREADALQLIGTGKTNKEVAFALGVAEVTVKMYVRSLCAKFGVRNRTQLAVITGGGIQDFPIRPGPDQAPASPPKTGGLREEDSFPGFRA